MDELSKVWRIAINCTKCGSKIESELEQNPNPNIYAGAAHSSRDSVSGILICSKCKNQIDYSVSNDFNNDIICIPKDLEIIKT